MSGPLGVIFVSSTLFTGRYDDAHYRSEIILNIVHVWKAMFYGYSLI